MKPGPLCLSFMGMLSSALPAAAVPLPGGALVPVPSGQEIRLQDVVLNARGPAGLTARFLFVAPAITREGGTVDFETSSRDMEHLCTSYALPKVLTRTGPQPRQIIISLSDVAVPFGELAPDATQFFETYAVEHEDCIWVPY